MLVWFALLEGLWAVFVGTQQDTELVAGLGAAALGAVFAELLRTQGLLAFTSDFGLLRRALLTPWNIVLDFSVLTWALVRALAAGRRVSGQWVEAPFVTEPGAVGNWQRAFAATIGTATPNAIRVDLDHDRVLLHSLDPRISTGRTAV